MSQALSTLSLTHGFPLAGRMQIPMHIPSLDASPCLDLLKKGDSLCSLHASHMLSTNPLLIGTRSLCVVDKQCSFLAFALQGDKRPTGNHRVQANIHEDDDSEDDDDILESFLNVNNGRQKEQGKRNNKFIKINAVGESEVTSHSKWESKPKEDNHDEIDTADKIIATMRKYMRNDNAAPSKMVVPKGKYSNVNPFHKRFNAQDSNGKPPDQKGAQNFARNRNLKLTYSRQDKSSADLDLLLGSSQQEHIENTTSPITAPVVKQQKQGTSISFQPENNGFADEIDNEKQHKSVAQHAASHVLDTSSITSVKAGENESTMNDNALQIDSSHIKKMDLSTVKLSDLRIMAKTHGLKGYSKLKRAELLELLKDSQLDDSSMYK